MKIAKDLQPLSVPIGTLKIDPQNTRRHGERSIAAIARSLADHGQQKPIVVNEDGVVLAGNGTLQAAKRLGATEIAVSTWTGDVQEAREYAIADNRTAQLSTWDPEILDRHIKSLPDWNVDEYDFEALLPKEEVTPEEPTSGASTSPHPSTGEKTATTSFSVAVTYEERGILRHALRLALADLGEGATDGDAFLHVATQWREVHGA